MEKSYKKRFNCVRFSSKFGPPSLFERVQYKMMNVHELNVDGPHFKQRLVELNVPNEVIEKIQNFNTDEWTLVTAEVREDRGRFVNSTWELSHQGHRFWITIGFGNAINTIVDKSSSGVEKCVRSGELYEMVERVNRKLMDDDLGANTEMLG